MIHNAFCGCTSIERVVLPEGITSIGYSAFYNCTGIKSIVLPRSLTSIGNEAFSTYSTEFIKDVYYRGSEAEWAQISIGSSNEIMDRATLHFDYVEQ